MIDGLAVLITQGTVPKSLQHKRVLALDLTALMAGACYVGRWSVLALV
jgi:ATP-dependent Clp protease ATP-binding subunit ClpA